MGWKFGKIGLGHDVLKGWLKKYGYEYVYPPTPNNNEEKETICRRGKSSTWFDL